MKIALLGYGKMGKIIEELAIQRNHEIVCRFNSNNPVNESDLSSADVAIEFSRPELASQHIQLCADTKTPVVVGTTAWEKDLEKLCQYIKDKQSAMLYSSNFSLGVNIFFEMNKVLAKLMSKHPSYKLNVKEIHHTEKLDAPSGTAVSIANDIISNNKRYSSWRLEQDETIDKSNSIPIIANRITDVPGTHIVNYNCAVDTIEMKHVAHNREGFAVGSIIAAEFLASKQGVFTMSDVLNI